MTAECLDSIAQATQTAAGIGARSAHAVICDGDLGPRVGALERDLEGACDCVLGDVRERLGGYEVQRGLMGGRQAAVETAVEDDWDDLAASISSAGRGRRSASTASRGSAGGRLH